MGDPARLLLLEEVLRVIGQQNLLKNVQKTGTVLKNGLLALEKEFPDTLHSVRGRGTFLAVTVSTTALRNAILEGLKQKGNLR